MKVKIKNTNGVGEELLKSIQEKNDNEANIVIKDSALVKMTKAECMSLCKKIGLKFKDGFEERIVQFRFTDATADRHNEVVKPEGVDLKSFKKDPTILLQHNSFKFPIGKSLETTFDKEKKDIVGKVLFLDDETDRTGASEDAFRMVKAGVLKSGSIGFTAKSSDVRLASPSEVKEYKLDKFGIVFDKIELREFSIVTIPANPNATTIPARKDAFRKSTLETLREKGLEDEAITFLQGKDDDADVNEPDTTEPNLKGITPMNIDINISKDAEPEELETKLKFAEMQQKAGNDVNITYGEKEETIINNISNDVNELSEENTNLINNVLTSLKTLTENFEALLNKGEPSKDDVNDNDDSDPESSIDKNGNDDESPSELYNILEKHNNNN